jgi:hypothetical protein
MVAAPFGNWTHDGASVNALASDHLGDIGNGPTFCDTLVEIATCGSTEVFSTRPPFQKLGLVANGVS